MKQKILSVDITEIYKVMILMNNFTAIKLKTDEMDNFLPKYTKLIQHGIKTAILFHHLVKSVPAQRPF